jgi:hypothetical protein
VTTAKASWESLTPRTLDAIEAQMGTILGVEMLTGGFNSEITAIIRTTAGDRVFVKGLRCDHPRVWTQDREALVNPHVTPIAPRLRWHIEAGGWNLLGFDHIDARPADYSPGSTDLATITDTLCRLGHLHCPGGLPLKRAESRWAHYSDTPELFAGDALLHTDWNPTNVLVGDTAHLVDWAWPTYGAAWIDPACWVVWLVAEGHTPTEAESVVADVPAWAAAPTAGLDAIAGAQARMWRDIANDDPDPWTTRIADAAATWADHRHS